MQIRYFATIRDITRENTLNWNQRHATLGELLRALCVRYGDRFRQWVLEGDELGQAIIILVNGCDARHLGGINTPLQPDDTIAIFPLVAGG
jgi:molybdopterin synthase sulfur carrier subunit